MSDITKVDKNFIIKTNLDLPDVTFFDCREEPFTLHGLCEPKEGEPFRRVPQDVAEKVSAGVQTLALHTSGGRVSFKTDSPYIAIKAIRRGLYDMSHATRCLIGGFDLYVKQDDGRAVYTKTFMPPGPETKEYDSVVPSWGGMREYIINFPLYGSIENLYIGLKEGCKLEKSEGYRDIPPVVYYGSSITQGGCASRPGTSYEGFISQNLNIDFINLGFSGSACGEKPMAEYIASLDMSAFVYDYDYNAPTNEHLAETHSAFLDIIREAHPDLPVICMPRPGAPLEDVRSQIVLKTVEDRVKAGDKNIWFLSGVEILAPDRADNCTVDGCHPTDLGFYFMAQAVEKKLREILSL